MAKIIKGNFGSGEKNDTQKINDDTFKNGAKKTVELKLSLNEREDSIISDIQRETLQDELNSLPPIYPGDINVAGVYAFDMGDCWEVKTFLRNGMKGPINFDKVALVIMNSKKEVLAAQTFNMQDVGILPAHSARPYKLNFDKENVYVNNIPADDWQIAFDSGVSTVVYEKFEFEGLPDTFPKESLDILNRFLRELPKVEEGKIDIAKFSIGINENGEIMISLVVRNAYNMPLTIGRLPVTLKNEEGTVVFSGLFDLQNIKVNSGKARFISMTCDTGVKLDKNMDLSNWEIVF